MESKQHVYSCDYCKKEIVGYKRHPHLKHHFCNRVCRGQYQTNVSLVKLQCKVCDKEFTKRRCFSTPTCSKKCGAKINPASQPQIDKRIIRACSNCKKQNNYCQSRSGAANYFCNRTCYLEFKQRSDVVQHVCKGCYAVFESIEPREYCSLECCEGTEKKVYKKQKYVHGLYRRVDGTMIPYDSSWELRRMRELDATNTIKHWSRCSWKVPYVDMNGKQRIYKPDFDITYKDGRRVIEEVKGLLTELDQLKRNAVEIMCQKEGCKYRLAVGMEQFNWNVPIIVEEYHNSYGTFGRPAMATIMMSMAKEISKRSTCLRNKVGAVVCDPDHTQIYSLGHNGDEPGGANECDSLMPGACGCLHAESTALMKANRDLTNCILYVTVAPCLMCSKSIVMAKIKKIVYLRKYRNQNGLELLKKHNVEVIHYEDLVEKYPRTQLGIIEACSCCEHADLVN